MNESVRAAARQLAVAGIENAEREASWLLAALLGVSRGQLWGRTLTPEEQQRYDAWVKRRSAREPLQYIIGTEDFMGLTFRVTPAVLIPRPETAVLVEHAAARLAPGAEVADIGTGSGAIAVAMAARGFRVWAVDISADALEVARENAALNGVQVSFRQGDLLDPLKDRLFDAILSNPPYVADTELPTLQPEVRDYEPHLALVTGTPDPLHFYRRLASGAPQLLRAGGLLGVEVGVGQARDVAAMFAAVGMRCDVYQDNQGIERTVIGVRP